MRSGAVFIILHHYTLSDAREIETDYNGNVVIGKLVKLNTEN